MRGDRIVVVLIALGSVACSHAPNGKKSESAQTALPMEHGMGGAPEIYEARGTVLWYEDERIYLNHEELPGFMDAMSMGFDVRDPALLEGIMPGNFVEFRVVVEKDSFYIDQLFPVE